MPPGAGRSDVDAGHTPFVIALALDASRQRIQGHPLSMGQRRIAGAEIRPEVLEFRRPGMGQDVLTLPSATRAAIAVTVSSIGRA